MIIVPEVTNDKMLKKVASYRTKNRLPVLDWIHPETGSALLRSSQPMVGLSETKNDADRKYLKLGNLYFKFPAQNPFSN